jgi:hypothetical protein
MRRNLEEAAKRNVGNTVVLARLFNEVQAQKMPNRMVRLILSEYLIGQNVLAGGWRVLIGDCVEMDVGSFDQAVLTFSDVSGNSYLAGMPVVVFDSSSDLNQAINDFECVPGTDSVSIFEVTSNIPRATRWFEAMMGG